MVLIGAEEGDVIIVWLIDNIEWFRGKVTRECIEDVIRSEHDSTEEEGGVAWRDDNTEVDEEDAWLDGEEVEGRGERE